jgi:BRCT domain type II-containing protein
MDRETFKQAVEKFGGTFTENFANANSIVLGEKPGPKKVEEINDNGYGTISEEHFYGMIGSVFAPPAKRAKKE